MKRRQFLEISAAAGIAGLVLPSCIRRSSVKGSIIGASAAIGHRLREKQRVEPTKRYQKKIVIIGAGISGLSAARKLQREGITDYELLDLEDHAGGHSSFGQNNHSSFPWGAHYIPTPNNDLTDYLEFLQEADVISTFDSNGLPSYNEEFICFDPQERLYINGYWQDGLVPDYGLSAAEKKQLKDFFELMDQYRSAIGNDGRQAFAIPVNRSSKELKYTVLDQVTMKDWLDEQKLDTDYLHEYVNYSCRDDFGTRYDEISAWTGIHYFAGRKGRASNIQSGDVLTWPEGNGYFVKNLLKTCGDRLRSSALATSVQQEKNSTLLVSFFDVQSGKQLGIECEQCIIAAPQYVAARLLSDHARLDTVHRHFHYTPWMVANLIVNNLEERSGAGISWDNVILGSEALGYVDASHQLLQQVAGPRNLTYYLPLTAEKPEEARKLAQQRTHEEWVKIIFKDLKKVHPNIEEAVSEINVMLWAHAMVQPLPGLIHGDIREKLAASIDNRIHFAHTDLAGISIFEEAFYQGIEAAKKVIASIKNSAT